jgi:hypothetical protein
MLIRFDAEDRPSRPLRPLQLGTGDIQAWVLAKDPTAIGSYLDLAPEEYARAFTAAQTAGTDIANDLYQGIVENLARNGSAADFAQQVIPILRAKGWLDGDQGQIASRVQLIYDTNLRLARAAGRWATYQKARFALPYLRAFTVGDERVRHPPKSKHSDHRAWDGIVLPVEHHFWTMYWPPLGFRCRCEVVQMTRSEFARYRDGVTSEAELADRIARLGPPVFLSPVTPIASQLAAMVAPSNNPPADKPRMPGLPPVNPQQTERQGRSVWDAVLAAQSREDIGRQLARIGF